MNTNTFTETLFPLVVACQACYTRLDVVVSENMSTDDEFFCSQDCYEFFNAPVDGSDVMFPEMYRQGTIN
jgi:hypothetical protein